jgi:DNA polymerase-1
MTDIDIILVDAKNAVYRHGYTRAQLRTSTGQSTGAIFGMLSCLIRLHRYYPKALFLFCWDGQKPKESWRHKLCPTYKSNRGVGEVPKEVQAILAQIPEIKKMLRLMGFAQFEVANIEADDEIGIIAVALAKRKDVSRVLVYSMDKDYFGLIDDKIHVVRDLDKSMKCKH